MVKNRVVISRVVAFLLLFLLAPVVGIANEIHDVKVIKITDTCGFFSQKSLYIRYYPNNPQWQTSLDGKSWMIVSHINGIKSCLLENIISDLKGKNHAEGVKILKKYLQTQNGDVKNNLFLTGYSTDDHGDKFNKILSIGDIPYSLKNKSLTKENQYYIFGQITNS